MRRDVYIRHTPIQLTQVMGSGIVNLGDHSNLGNHQVTLEPSDLPLAGTLLVQVKPAGTATWQTIYNGTIDLTDPLLRVFTVENVYADSFKFILDSFDAEKTLTITVGSI